MTNNQRFRRLTDLFVTGRAVSLPDGSYLWVQVNNDFERDEALNDAQVARARLIAALRDDERERIKVVGRLAEIGRERMIEELVEVKAESKTGEVIQELRVDPEWKERLNIILRTDWQESAKSATPAETVHMAKINEEVLTEITKREKDEREYQSRRLDRMTDEDLVDEWIDEWLERRGGERANAEFKLTELWYATRYCDAGVGDDGQLDHARCAGHRERVFETKSDARSMPNQLQALLRTAVEALNMDTTDPKDSGSPVPSSDTSPTPSAPEVSTVSTPTPDLKTAPGI